MGIVGELFADSKPRLENFQNTYFEEFFKRSSILQCLKQMRRTVAVSKNNEPVVFRDSFVDSLGTVQHILVTFYVNKDYTYMFAIDLISEDYYDYGKYERGGTREQGFYFTFSEVTKNLQVQFVNYANWFDRKEILHCLEELFS